MHLLLSHHSIFASYLSICTSQLSHLKKLHFTVWLPLQYSHIIHSNSVRIKWNETEAKAQKKKNYKTNQYEQHCAVQLTWLSASQMIGYLKTILSSLGRLLLERCWKHSWNVPLPLLRNSTTMQTFAFHTPMSLCGWGVHFLKLLPTEIQGCYWLLSALGSLCPNSVSFLSLFPLFLFSKLSLNAALSTFLHIRINLHSKQSQLLQLWRTNTRQHIRRICLLLLITGLIADHSAFVVVITPHWLPKLFASHMDEWLLHVQHNMLSQRAVSILSQHICDGTASFEMGHARDMLCDSFWTQQGTIQVGD